MTAERVSLAPQPNKGVTMPRKKKEETIEDIIDRIESDLETIRDKSVEDQNWEEDIDEEDIDDDEDDDYDEDDEIEDDAYDDKN
jgi:DNA-directed RNA polymerase subunit delta